MKIVLFLILFISLVFSKEEGTWEELNRMLDLLFLSDQYRFVNQKLPEMLDANYSPFKLVSIAANPDKVITNFNENYIKYNDPMPENCRFLDDEKEYYLKKIGFTKFICPYGILIIGSPRFPDSYMRYAANVVGHLIDPSEKGIVSDQ